MEIYMNKKLIAIAIAAAVSAPAMAATSNVEVYGLMSVGVDSVTNGYTQPATATAAAYNTTNRVGRVSDYSSRIGFKGSEDLGNGLKAIWQIEQAVAVNGGNSSTDATSSGTLGGGGLRNTFVGLSSKDMGEVRLGRHDTPYKMSTARLDPFADTLGDYNGLVGNATGTGSKASAYFDIRANDVVAYITPNFSGFSAVGAYVFGNAQATNQTGTSSSTGTANTVDTTANAYSLAAMYEAGPMYLTAAYEKHNLGAAGVGSLATTTADAERKAWKLGAQYSIMDFTLNALYEKTSDNLGSTTGGANAVGSDRYGHGTWYLSGKYQMGAIALKAAYAKANSTSYNYGTSTTPVTGNDGAKQYTLGADYAFSKRTTVYALYTHVSNDTNGAFTTDAGNAPILNVTGQSVSGFSLGMKHSF
jgi:predicted porin